MDGKYAYIQKKPGVLGLVSNFRSIDFLIESQNNSFVVRGSPFKTRLIIESIPDYHEVLNLNKNHEIFVIDYGNTVTRRIGNGRNAKLHLKDEWISYFNTENKSIHLENLITQKKFEIKLSKKLNPFFLPEVEMISSGSILYSDINESGFAALVSFDLASLKSSVIYKSSQNASKIELCGTPNYIAFGEFPYEGVTRSSRIQVMNLGNFENFSSFTTLYHSKDQDTGNMICHDSGIFFIKALSFDQKINYKVTEAVRLDLKDKKIETRSNLKQVNQLIEMDGRIIAPFKGDFFVVEGKANISEEILKASPSTEELEVDI